jgi:hypothetical protein
LGLLPLGAAAVEVTVPGEGDLSVTVYRAPGRSAGQMELDDLNGFALVTETRTVTLPEGDNRIRFEGVADGIEPASAIITGLPGTLLEKNRDARLLSPSELVAAALGRSVMLVRTNPKTGRVKRLPAKIRSDAGDGVVFETSEGVEALRCSGLPESFGFLTKSDLSSTPTLSARVHSPSATTAKVTLSYLARGFDWMASYVATLAPDEKSMSLGAWITLGNSNGTAFPAARTQIVAGRINHSTDEVEPLDLGSPILARCWPLENTSDALRGAMEVLVTAEKRSVQRMLPAPAPPVAMALSAAKLVQQEELGDLKLYRVPDRTTLKSRQIKQVRLLDRQDIPVELFYGADLPANYIVPSRSAQRTIRTRNDAAHHLGLPLPSGSVASFLANEDATLLLDETPLHDTALDEEIELDVGTSTAVQVRAVMEKTTAYTRPPFLRGVARYKSSLVDEVSRVEIHNADGVDIQFELRLQLLDGTQLIGADAPLSTRDGRPLFKLLVPANRTVTVRYQTEHISNRPTHK